MESNIKWSLVLRVTPQSSPCLRPPGLRFTTLRVNQGELALLYFHQSDAFAVLHSMSVSSLRLIGAVLVGSGWLTSIGWPRDSVLQNDTRFDPNPPTAFDPNPPTAFSEAGDPDEWLTCPIAGPCTCPCSSMPLVSETSGKGTVVVNLNLTAKCEPEHSLPVLNASDFGAAETWVNLKMRELEDAGTMPEALCADKNLKMCPLWAQKGECEANPDYMRASCKLSCGLWYSKKAEDSVVDPVATELSPTKLKRLAASVVWIFGVFTLATCIAIACGKCGEAFRWGHLATGTLAATFATALTALALPPAPLDTSLVSAAAASSLSSALLAILGTRFGAAIVHAQRIIPAPQTFWPPAIHVESIPLSAPVPPAFICPITMAPMANPAITFVHTNLECVHAYVDAA